MFEDVQYEVCGKFVSRDQWTHTARSRSSHEIIFVLNGEVHIRENNVEYHLRKNDVLFLEGGQFHAGTQYSNHVSFYWLHWFNGPLLPFKYKHIDSPYNLSLLFKQITNFANNVSFQESKNYLTRLILIELFSLNTNTASNLTNQVAAWIRANYDQPIQVKMIADFFGYNVNYLSRKFHEEFGISIKQYIDEVRITHIKQQLLNSRNTLSEIASSAGFSEYKIFLKFFKYHEGLTPTEFRKSYSHTHINTN